VHVLLFRRERADFGLALRVRELAQFFTRTARDGGAFIAGLKATFGSAGASNIQNAISER